MELSRFISFRLTLVLFALLLPLSALAQEWHPELTEQWEPVPAIVEPGTGTGTSAPSDAIILFDGSNLDAWESVRGGNAGWVVAEGAMTVSAGVGDIRTRQQFRDVQLHIEWRTPAKVEGDGQGRGNSGVFFHELYEVQVLDSYDNTTYPNGQAASVYKQHIPLVNASRGPGVWQVYDIVFSSPVFAEDGDVVRPAFVTVFHNGVLVQNHVEVKGGTAYIGLPEYIPHGAGSIKLQDHGNPTSYRNVWVREL
ncbi:MAG: DUF1080 domain-containing protein [Bacteroidetes Order II. Incertae sedis bacterium]|jgi:hypothetical protein|nr:DUF1080 domain-containing protein [Bacteroidetes Order II. bacterium]MBT4052543.1 DUF1080 domain-containing protein [Bacteroidetes Order II. bacterium]MBT4602932.1 DUF1080 domain-containing protein [Bacteroidetes Order II. bacterium]MBT5248716.1 DUF1080 domain-containing protein [Bacteroidetes Order II. bacterium]MBT6201618.1 DUF1080 domain-containing protein [Bacteroidetes Order II. bacterium]